MKIEDLEKVYAKLPQVSALAHEIGTSASKRIFLEGLLASSAPMLFGSLAAKCKAPILFILQDAEEAGYFYHDLTQLLGQRRVLFFPSSYRRAIKYGQLDAASQILRTEVMTQLSTDNCQLYIVTYPEALAEMVVPKQTLNARTLTIERGQQVAVGDIVKQLRELGFSEVDYVYEPGQFALRGSILDVYSYSCEYPYRVDFFGDDVDSVRTFQVEDQLSLDARDRVEIVPELEASDTAQEPFLSLLPADTIIATKDYLYVRDAIDAAFQEGMPLVTGPQFMHQAEGFCRIEFGHRASVSDCSIIRFNITIQPLFHKNFELLFQAFDNYIDQGYQLYILADSPKQNERLKDIFAQRAATEGEQADIRFTPVDKTLHEGFIDDDLKVCFFTDHQIFDRFHKYNLKSDKARSGKMALTLKEIQQFEIGDYVVHVDHGVGKFGGLVRMPQGDGYQEMIKLTYQHGDAIYVSIHSLYKVAKYKSQDGGEAPRLSTLGTGQWERLKERTKAHIKEIARDLIKLYAKRRREKGFAFSHDSYLQHELEASFLYEDTPDQLKATQDVKADMEKARPMDRLVCGDVGFGKTEVAVRAAFKAAVDGKQVAVLVPTTVLAYQHFRTFSKRLKDMPVTVDYLTRARTTKDTTRIQKDLAEGKIDIIIGTHRLISKSVKFKDLGLLIIDEEQKFGVSTKEKLRQMKTSVDTLTMSATPIPRTLQFSLVGARDLSVIQTPPPNRYPIQTEIHTFSPEIIAEAVNYEMSRNGQVYFVHNRIADLPHIAEIIQKYVPDARICIGHGQMKPEELEKIILDFSNYDFDILLSTTIVENGIDIPNANTIIINGAHNFGLSDLHQMRGRVGRGNRKAFCYLLAPPLSALNPESRRRLEALENFSDLGSGINIAMQDLDIRGAGNLLGSEQSGFIADLGYETYQKILNQAMAELKNEEPEFAAVEKADAKNDQQSALHAQIAWVDDCALDSDIEMYYPDQYVPSDSERMLLYRELDNLANSTQLELQLDAYRKRLIDRFGPIPAVSEELITVVPLRVAGKQLGIEKIMLKQQKMYFYFVSRDDSPYFQSEAFGRILQYVSRYPRRCNFREGKGKHSVVISEIPTVAAALSVCQEILSI
ncbi:transcription-repair coupling factor [Prevotella sp. P6B1]|uniref:transcription-repair coupling factor n=1 Tax=Prevotella sp. P6B1 TaxID=1410613 RepID=UPI00051B0BA3|nr:transcription-repair coupling factor [Prevotella sp. P6B1]